MSSQALELTNAGKTDVIPGYTLSKPTVIGIGLVEEQFAASYLETLAKSCAVLPRDLILDLLKEAKEDIAKCAFAYGTENFDKWINKRSVAPLLTWVCLRDKHPKTTYEEVVKLYADGDSVAYRNATLDLFGYVTPLKNVDAGGGDKSGSPGTSEPSSSGSVLPPQPDSASPPATSAT